MYIIALITLAGYLILWLISRNTPARGKGFVPVLRMAARIYDGLEHRIGQKAVYSRNLLNLKKLKPGEEDEQLLRQYYVDKLGLVLTLILAGTILATAVFLQTEGQRRLRDGNLIERGDYREPQREVQLEALVEGYPSQSFQFKVNGKVPDKDTVDLLEQEFFGILREKALSGNVSWEAVCDDLMLQESLENYPFVVEWSSDSPHIVDDTGSVSKLDCGEEKPVKLTAVITYHKWEWIHTIDLTVTSQITEEEMMRRQITEMLDIQDEGSLCEEDILLPGVWQDKEIHWKEQVANHGLTLWAMIMIVGVGIFFLKDKDLEQQVKDRQKQLKEAYPGIVHKLELYLGAGLTIRGAFVRMGEEYLHARQTGGGGHPAYEEMLHACRELQMGISEVKVYERFGARCGQQEYVRLSALLAQALVKGSGELSVRLREESEAAMKEQLQHSRQLGEEASTKLLVPMVMMLGIVMVMIMIPAFGMF